MVRLRSLRNLPSPNAGLLFLIAGLAVGNYSYEKYQQKYLNKRDVPSNIPEVGERNNNGESTSSNDPASNINMIRLREPHPLDPLTALEMQYVGRIVKQHNTTAKWQFKCIGLHEPDKTLMYPYFKSATSPPPGLIPRRAMALICCPVKRAPIFVVVNLSTGKVESWTDGDPQDKVPAITVEDNELTRQIALSDPAVLSRLKAKGYNDVSNILARVWDSGYVADNPVYAKARKLVQVYFYATKYEGNNFYAHPFDFVVYIELGPNVVRGIENLPIQQDFDTSNRQGDSVPTTDYDYFAELLQPTSFKHISRLQISQPNGPSYKISGREVSWQGFNFRIGFNPREGFYLYTISFNDTGKIRPLIYRLSISESQIIFADPRPPYHRKSNFDVGNHEFGASTRQLPVHQFCRGRVHYFQADQHNENAGTYVVHNSLCITEEDAGLLWAHHDVVSGKTDAIRNQRLVVSSLVSYGHMDFWVSWRFYQDAGIELDIDLTGIQSTNLLAVGVKSPPYGTLVAPQLYSQNYQHFFAVRADIDIDGPENTLVLEDFMSVTPNVSDENPYGNGMILNVTSLTTPAEAKTESRADRGWVIRNTNEPVNSISGRPPAYYLYPSGSIVPNKLTPDSPILNDRLNWTKYGLWALPYDPDQLYAAGEYLNSGVDYWTRQNADVNITNTDIVLFHVFNYFYIPRPENWPIASSHSISQLGSKGCWFRPHNFFNQNPALYAARASETTLLDDSPYKDRYKYNKFD